MADQKISELTNILGADVGAGDEFVVVDSSANETKAITTLELRTAIGNGDFTVTGDLTVQGTTITVDSATAQNIVLGDNDKMTFGAGSDLQIYSNGTNSFISESNATGSLFINASNLVLRNTSGEYYFYGNSDGAVNLYYDNASKLATTSTGIDVTGTVTADGLTVNGGYLTVDNGYGISTVGGLKYIADSDNNAPAAGLIHQFFTDNGTTKAISIAKGGDISFYEDTGTTPKFFWDASAEKLGLNTTSPAALLDLKHNSASTHLRLTENTSGNWSAFGVDTSDNLRVYVNNTERMRIDSSGNVGIGTSSPSDKLHIGGSVGDLKLKSSGAEIEFTRNGPSVLTASNANGYLIFQTGGLNERMRIDNSGQVGIGTSSPSSLIHAVAPTGATAIIEAANGYNSRVRISSNVESFLEFGDSADSDVGEIVYNHSSNYMRFNTNASERMRIDSSGNLLVGRTTLSGTDNTSGAYIFNEGALVAQRSSNPSLYLNRYGTDGDIALFRKDGSTVGSIGVLSSRLTIGRGGVGLFFDNISSDAIEPHSMSANAVRTDAISLGAVGSRFKDLYLSGGVYLGGTGSANKLDDYEEGTWTPSLGGTATYNFQSGFYTKVGRQVTLVFYMDVSSIGTGSTSTITGVPFSSTTFAPASGAISRFTGTAASYVSAFGQIDSSSITIVGKTSASTSTASLSPFQNGTSIYMTITYFTS